MKNITSGIILSCFVINNLFAATVSRIEVIGNQRMDSESIRILAGVQAGDNVGESKSNQIAKKLQESGYFSKIKVQMNGNTLKINVQESPIINMVTVEGNDEVSTEDLKKEHKIQLVGFGTFEVSERAAREGRNPLTGAPMKIAASKAPKFKAGKALKDALN